MSVYRQSTLVFNVVICLKPEYIAGNRTSFFHNGLKMLWWLIDGYTCCINNKFLIYVGF